MEQVIRLHIEKRIEGLTQFKDNQDIELYPELVQFAEYRIRYFEQALEMLNMSFSGDIDDTEQKEKLVREFVKILATAHGFIPPRY